MNKPTIFFSHSSLDKAQMNLLKDAFCSKTAGTIDVFLSSDGQSIPLGRNWVYRVQEALEAAALMLVFITPQSINSSWVYFEAGYSHAKKVRVIPIGFLGIDLARLGPPISLLQGFNITSSDALNNLIALANEQFSYKHPLTFLPEDYEAIVGSGVTTETGPLREVIQYIDEIQFELVKRVADSKKTSADLINDITAILKAASIEHKSEEDSLIRMHGVSIGSSVDTVGLARVKFRTDPTVIHATLPILAQIIESIRGEGVKGIAFDFVLNEGVEVVSETHKVTARLYSSGIQLGPRDELLFRNLMFSTDIVHLSSTKKPFARADYVRIKPIGTDFLLEDAAALLKLLLTRRVIYQKQNILPYDG